MLEDAPLHPAKVFSSLTLFMCLASPLYLVTLMVNTISHAYISTQRIQKFLATPELGYCAKTETSREEDMGPNDHGNGEDCEPLDLKYVSILFWGDRTWCSG